MLETNKMTVGEIRDVLVRQYGVTREEADSLTPKSLVVAKLREYETDEAILESAEPVEDVVGVESVEINKIPSMQDQEWTAYVLSLMYKDELVEGAPTVDGLRRIADNLVGPIRSVISKIEQSPDLNNNFHSTVRVRVATDDFVVDGCADAGPNNCRQEYGRYPVAMAESRAESRAYRKLLRLRNVISAEEAVKEEQIYDPFVSITTTQISVMDKILQKLNINAEKWLKSLNIDVDKFDKLTKEKGIELCDKLNALRASGDVIPEDLQGYKFDWRLS